jgi:hypothetical protein
VLVLADAPEPDTAGAWLSFGATADTCSRGLLDPEDVRHFLSPAGALEKEARVYAIRLALDEAGPSVASVNGASSRRSL